MIRVLLYLAVIVLSNIVTAKFVPFQWGVFIIPYGTLFIGMTFILRDLVQQKYGRAKTYMFIALALIISAVSSYLLGDTLWIVFASALSFLVAETTDTEIYTRLKLPLHIRVLYSGLVGGVLDSVVFVVIGLSPMGAGFIPWEGVFYAILGQIVFKTVMQFIGAVVVKQLVSKHYIPTN